MVFLFWYYGISFFFSITAYSMSPFCFLVEILHFRQMQLKESIAYLIENLNQIEKGLSDYLIVFII